MCVYNCVRTVPDSKITENVNLKKHKLKFISLLRILKTEFCNLIIIHFNLIRLLCVIGYYRLEFCVYGVVFPTFNILLRFKAVPNVYDFKI